MLRHTANFRTLLSSLLWIEATIFLLPLRLFLFLPSAVGDSNLSMDTPGTADDQAISVRLNSHFEGDFVILTCDVRNRQRETRIFMSCPLMQQPRSCFQECNPACKPSMQSRSCSQHATSILSNIRCEQSSQSASNLLNVSYWVDSRLAGNVGDWRCRHAGVESDSVQVELRIPLSTTVSLTSSTTSATITSQPSTATIFTSPKQDRAIRPEDGTTTTKWPRNNHDPSEKRTRLQKNVTRPELVIAVFVLLLVSLLINAVFCTRCWLVRRFIILERTGRSPSSCLLQCLCIPVRHYKAYSRTRRQPQVANSSSMYLPVMGDPSSGHSGHMSSSFMANHLGPHQHHSDDGNSKTSLQQIPSLRYLNMTDGQHSQAQDSVISTPTGATGSSLIYEDLNHFSAGSLSGPAAVKGRRYSQNQPSGHHYQNPAQTSGCRRSLGASRSFTQPTPTNSGPPSGATILPPQTVLVPAALYTDPQSRTVFALPLSPQQHGSTGLLYNPSSGQLYSGPTPGLYDEVAGSRKALFPVPASPGASPRHQVQPAGQQRVTSPLWEEENDVSTSKSPNTTSNLVKMQEPYLDTLPPPIPPTTGSRSSTSLKLTPPTWRSEAISTDGAAVRAHENASSASSSLGSPHPLLASSSTNSNPVSSSGTGMESGMPILERPSKLDLSRTLLFQADNLLKEANSLLQEG